MKINVKLQIKKIKCPGGLPGLQVDEMSGGDSEGNMRSKENQERVGLPKAREGSISRRRKRELRPVLLRGPGR